MALWAVMIGDKHPVRFMVIFPLFELYETGWVVGVGKVNPATANAALTAVTNSVGA